MISFPLDVSLISLLNPEITEHSKDNLIILHFLLGHSHVMEISKKEDKKGDPTSESSRFHA